MNKITNRPVRTAVTHSITNQLWVQKRPTVGCWQLSNLVQQISVCVQKACLVQAGDCVIVQHCVSVTPPVVLRLKWLRNVHWFTDLSVQRHAIHSSSTLRCHYKMSVVHCITCKALLLSLPSITFLSVTPFPPTVWPNNCDLPKITLPLRTLTVTLHILTLLVFTIDRNDWHVLLTSPGLTACCSFSTDTSHDQASCSDKMALLAWPQLITSFRSLAAPATEPPA